MTLFNIPKNGWENIIKDESKKDYFKNIEERINEDIHNGKIIYPETKNIFAAFEKTDIDKLKVVIIGQDPYHQKGQAQGFCFSVPNGFKLPPSLKNIFKEINNSLGINNGENGDLTPWTQQGVFLINASLTVEESKPMSHAKIGWETFTDNIIKYISDNKSGVIFLLWGGFAQSKKKIIDKNKHIILETSHPSPLGSYRGFLGSNQFKEVNEILKNKGEKEINWKT